MRRHYALLALLFLTACTFGSHVQRTPLEDAELAYAQTSIAYEATMLSLQDARALGRATFPDSAWSRVEDLQKIVQRYTPNVRSLLNLWRTAGTKPATFDETLTKIADAGVELQKILASVTAKKKTSRATPPLWRTDAGGTLALAEVR